MSTLLRHRPSPAMVVACIALAIALGGTSYAAIRLPANSVGTKQLKKNAVKRSKIAAKAVNGSKVAPDSLTGANILESSLGPVPSATNATNATHATSADSATNATHATSADNATHATSADTAANGIKGTGSFAGFAGASIAGGASAYVFVGPTVTATTTASERLVGAAEAPLGSTLGVSLFIYGLCYQPSGGGAITNFVGGLFSFGTLEAGTARKSFAATATVVPGAGTWKVGYCVLNISANPLNQNDFVNGWIQIVNATTGLSSPITSNLQSSRPRQK